MVRTLEPLPVPTGEAVLELLPRLARALDGHGPALLPVPAADAARTALVAAALGAGAPLVGAEDDPDDPTAFVVPTSGSTGSPKGALLPGSALRASASATHRRLAGAGPAATWLLALPAHHVAGLQVLLRALAGGAVPTVLDTGLPFTAGRFVDAVGRMPAGPRHVSLVPTQLRRILADDDATAALARFDAVMVGGSATHPSLIRAAVAAGVPVVRTYGMTETCAGCVYDGVPLDGVTVQADADDPDGPGRLRLIGPVVARGYRGIAGHPAFFVDPGTGRRGFRTDDLGVLTDGRWQILGRVDDVIISGGIKVAPGAVESTLSEAAGVADLVLTGIPDPEWGELPVAVVVPAPAGPPDLEALRAAAQHRHGRAAAPRALILVDELPLRGPGKPDRSAVREQARRALIADPGPMDGTRVIDVRAGRGGR